MIHPNTKVVCLDVATGRDYKNTIEEMFVEYADKVRRITDTCRTVYLGTDSTLKIQDWQGWTTVFAIKCFENQESNWINLFSRPHPEINVIVSKFELIPFYGLSMMKSGFHGSVKFPYMLRHPEKCDPEKDRMRVRGDLEGSLPEFHEPMWSRHDEIMHHGYEIITASNFYNANNIHLYGNDEVPLEALKEWGWK